MISKNEIVDTIHWIRSSNVKDVGTVLDALNIKMMLDGKSTVFFLFEAYYIDSPGIGILEATLVLDRIISYNIKSIGATVDLAIGVEDFRFSLFKDRFDLFRSAAISTTDFATFFAHNAITLCDERGACASIAVLRSFIETL